MATESVCAAVCVDEELKNKPIDITIVACKAFVWNVDDVLTLRRDHRIVGSLIGCLPRCPNQNKQLGIPLQLMAEEATLLRDKGFCRLVSFDRTNAGLFVEEAEKFKELRESQYWEQNKLFIEERRKYIKETIDSIVDGKRRRLNGEPLSKKMKRRQRLKEAGESSNKVLAGGDGMAFGGEEDETSTQVAPVTIDRDEVLAQELAKLDELVVPRDSINVQLFSECPWAKPSDFSPATWTFPRTDDEKLRQRVFTDLWERGKHLTSGHKFGGDYLVYPGDPALYHASHIAVCLSRAQHFTGMDVIAKGRLCSDVKKRVLLCSLDEHDRVTYVTLQWAAMN